jgi:hypothetical protein
LHPVASLRILAAMRSKPPPRRHPLAVAAILCCLTAACGNRAASDPDSREVPWTYGPLQGGATAEHLAGAGKKDGVAIAKGWQCRLQGGKRLVVRPYQLAAAHPLFDKVALSIGLFDKSGAQIGEVRSGRLTAGNASSTFDLDDATAARLWDVVLWYVKD